MEPRVHQGSARPYVLVVGVKFDSVGEMTIDEAVRLADGHRNAIVHLCHVVEELVARDALHELLDARAEMLQVFVLDKIRAVAHPLTERIRLHVAAGDIAASLVRFACDTHADAIVVGASPATGDAGVVSGAVAARLSDISPCSVFVVRPPNYQGRPVAAVAEPDPFGGDEDRDEPPSSRHRRHVRLRWVGNLAPMQDHTLSR